MIEVMRRVTDPRTKEACAFYAVLGVSAWDVITRGFHMWNVIVLASLCGVGVVGGVVNIIRAMKGAPGTSRAPGNASEEN